MRACRLLIAVAAIAVLSACSGGDETEAPAVEESTEDTGTPGDTADADADEVEAADTAETGPGDTTSGDDPPVIEGDPMLPALDVEAITLTTPAAGEGLRPVFAWEPVEGAAEYSLTVHVEDGEAYWAWRGEDTAVRLGGASQPVPDGAAGPRVDEGMSWWVIAFDTDGRIIAQSGQRPIGP